MDNRNQSISNDQPSERVLRSPENGPLSGALNEPIELYKLFIGDRFLYHGKEYVYNTAQGHMCEVWEAAKDRLWCWPSSTMVVYLDGSGRK